MGGGPSIVNATGWNAAEGYAVDWVPSLRMVVDLADSSDAVIHPPLKDLSPLALKSRLCPGR